MIRLLKMRLLFSFTFVLTTSISLFSAEPGPWKSLFNGKDLTGWEINKFAGAGPVTVENGTIVIGTGVALTGIRRTNDLLKTNYEIAVRAKKIEGDDFFCGVTFPVKDSNATFIAGGWGGSLVGVSSIDGLDASENETTQYLRFEKNRWYDIKIRVTDSKIEAWIDKEKLVNVNIAGRKVSMRPGEIEDAVPFGISSYQTTAAIQDVKIRSVPSHIPSIAFIAGKKSHGPGEHEYEKSLKLLQNKLESSIEFIDTQIHIEGWPFDDEKLEGVDTIVLFCDGADRGENNHPLLQGGGRLKALERQMKRGAGLVCLHYSVFVPKEKAGDKFLQWIGGYFDYERGPGTNHWFSKIETRDYEVFPATPAHPICKDLKPFTVKEEFYYNIKFPDDKKNLTPIITFDPDKKDWQKVVGWAIDRPDGGRGFGYTGGHFYRNFEDPNVQKLLLNAILWTAHADISPK